MNITYQERQELNALSQKAFGISSKWKKFLDNGYFETFTRDRQAMVAGADGKMDKKTFVDKKHVKKYPTIEEIRKFMTEEIAKMEAAQATSVKVEENETIAVVEETAEAIASNERQI